MMDDILKEIDFLSARFKDNLETTSVNNSREDLSKIDYDLYTHDIDSRGNRKRKRRRKGRKRRMEDYIELDMSQSSSSGNLSDELVMQDYITNIAMNASDSDIEVDKIESKSQILNNILKVECVKFTNSPLEMAESDSFSEAIGTAKSLRRRRRSKRSNKEESIKTVLSDNLSGDVFMEHTRDKRRHKRERVRSGVPLTHLSSSFVLGTGTSECAMIDISLDAGGLCHQMRNASLEKVDIPSDEAESGLSDLGLDADDEAEESCFESSVEKLVPWWDDDNAVQPADPDFDRILKGSFPLLTLESQKLMQLSLGRNTSYKLNDQFDSIFKVNEEVEGFLKSKDHSKLFLNVSEKTEQDQIRQLSALYCLQCHIENVNGNNRIILIKTRQSKHPDRASLINFIRRQKKSKFNRVRSGSSNQWDNKRQKICQGEDVMICSALPDANKGSQMLRGMGWMPGTGLGKDNAGRVDPVKAIKRPRRVGLGYDVDMV